MEHSTIIYKISMKRFIFLFCIIAIVIDAKGQANITPPPGGFKYDPPPPFEEELKLIGMTYTPNSHYIFIDRGEWPQNACNDEDCPIRRLELVHAKLVHEDGQCEAYIFLSGVFQVRYGAVIKANSELFGNSTSSSFNRIKHDFRYGNYGSASPEEIEVLKTMVQDYSKDVVKEVFNADYALSYPFEMDGKVHQDNFTSARAVVAIKNGLEVFIYFVLTDNGIKDFDKYLSDFKGVLLYKD